MLSDRIFAVAHVADQIVLWILVILSVVSVGMILERFFTLSKVSRKSEAIRAQIKLALQAHSVEDIEGIAKFPDTIEGRALALGLKHIKETGSNGLEEVFNAFALTEKPELEKYLSFLATVGSNAPYIGLLGTVLGIMKAFNVLAQSSEAGQQTVMAGISLALVATAAGLFVAIPAVISYNYYQRKVKSIMVNLESVKEMGLAYAKKKGR